jgi:hypothetical protein
LEDIKVKKFNAAALLLAGLAVLALVAAPTVASAGPPGNNHKSKATITCKSGKHVDKARKCKENGGKK